MEQSFVLGIDTSDFEPVAGVVINGNLVGSDVRASEFAPTVSDDQDDDKVISVDHLDYIDSVVQQALDNGGIQAEQLDCIAVTQGPGHIGNLQIGLNFAKGMAFATGKPLVGVNLREANIFSAYLNQTTPADFPVLALIVSGFATELVLVHDFGQYEIIARTRDDTAGEIIEKIGNVLELPFPTKLHVEQAASLGNAHVYRFDKHFKDSDDGLSLNNLKLAVLDEITVEVAKPDQQRQTRRILQSDVSVNNVAASFQATLIDYLANKTRSFAKKLNLQDVIVVGDLSANQALRKKFSELPDLTVRFPTVHHAQNNGAMVAMVGHFLWHNERVPDSDLSAKPRWQLATTGETTHHA